MSINFLSMLERPVAFHRVFVDVTGCANAALLLSQIHYWHPRAGKEDWFHKTSEEWSEEIGLTVRELETARRTLVNLGVIEYRRAGMPAKPYYRLDHDRLNALLAAIYNARNADVCSAENAKQDTRKTQDMSRGKRVAKYSETTSSTFTDVQVGNKPCAPGKPARIDFLSILIADGVSEQTAADFIAHRKSLRAPLTQTALDAIKREAAAARLSLEAALAECVMRGWRGFKAEWVLKTESQPVRQGAAAPFDPVAFVNQNRVGQRPGLQGFDSDPFDSLKVVNP